METEKSLTKQNGKGDTSLVVYETPKGEVVLSPHYVRHYFCPNATLEEIVHFMQLCRYQGLNPWLREAYLVKYGTEPAAMITGKETFLKRASRHPHFDGYDTGVKTDGNGKLLSAWASVYRKDRGHPVHIEADYAEYVQTRKDGQPNRFWREKPKTMLRKVALVQALREAFPEELGGLLSPEETAVEMNGLPTAPIEAPTEPEAPQEERETSGDKPQIKDPTAAATEKQLGRIARDWAVRLDYEKANLKTKLEGANLTKGNASTLIEMADAGNFDLIQFGTITGFGPAAKDAPVVDEEPSADDDQADIPF